MNTIGATREQRQAFEARVQAELEFIKARNNELPVPSLAIAA